MRTRISLLLSGTCLLASSLFGGFGSTETFLPAVGRVSGQGGAQFYTTVWATNLTTAPQTMTFRFLKQGQANGSPASFVDTLQPGETKVYENVVESKLGLSNAIGAARVSSTGEIFVSERIFNQAPGADLGNTEGLFFAGVPKSFSISAGQSASIQGINQGGSENFRYNFALIETGGGSPTVNVQVFDAGGVLLGQKSYPLQPYEQLQPGIGDVVAGIKTTNARITAAVTGGTGSVLLAGAQLANESQDSSGFEMTFRDELLGGSSSGGGLTSVIHDSTLLGSGTGASPLGLNPAAVVTSLSGLHGGVTLSAGPNVTITPLGSTLTIASSGGGGGGLTLPFSGSANAGIGVENAAFDITNSGGAGISSISTLTNSALSIGVYARAPGFGVEAYGTASNGTGVVALGGSTGVEGHGPLGVVGYGTGATGLGVFGNGDTGVAGLAQGGSGVTGESTDGSGVEGESHNHDGVRGLSLSTGSGGTGVYGASHGFSGETGWAGVWGDSHDSTAVQGTSHNDRGVLGITSSAASEGVEGLNRASSGVGVLGRTGGGSGLAPTAGVGVWGDAQTGYGVIGSSVIGVWGRSAGGTGALGVYYTGGLAGTGPKSFVEPHPTDPTKQIRYVCLEGPESGTYFRGRARVANGFATIVVPDDFRMVTSETGLTVVATPVGALAVLAAIHQDLDRIVIQGSADVEFNYIVNGVRKAIPDWRPVEENRFFIPRGAVDPFLVVGLPPENLDRLKQNGTLNTDGTVNLETAHRLRWDQQESWKRAEGEKK